MKDILALIEKVGRPRGKPEHAAIHEYCRTTQLSLREFCNRLALSLAQGFHEGRLGFEFCDETLTFLFNFIMEPQFLESAEGLPQPAFAIFQAFDATEYYRGSEPPKVDPVEQYTRPRIAEILRRHAPG